MKLQSQLLTLKPIGPQDIEMLRQWRNAYRKDFFSAEEITKEQQRQWYEKYKENEGRDYMWLILAKGERSTPVGTIALYNISLPDRTAEIGRILILEEYRDKGFAASALQLVTEFAFETLHLYKLRVFVFLNNSAAIAMYDRCGYSSLPNPVMIMEQRNTDRRVFKKPVELVNTED